MQEGGLRKRMTVLVYICIYLAIGGITVGAFNALCGDNVMGSGDDFWADLAICLLWFIAIAIGVGATVGYCTVKFVKNILHGEHDE